ncbi:MAG: hypothetical protein KDI03_09720 [Anaerolineae bacterium]|nr:hypothetical protein [Anaerolineae bacterium]MCB0203790.1 hypothetical protein [Anaerolineae bacterium]MCB0252485.1 hypothetical protein [Anaerolineae bacterium]
MIWPKLGVILLLMLFGILPVSAQSLSAVVRSDPSVLEISPGQTVTLTVVLDDAKDVYGIDVRASFDPQVVEVVDADPAKEGIQMIAGTFPQPDFVARNVADNEAGTLRYAITQVNPTEPANGSGTIYSVQFRAKTDAGESPFTIGLVEMADRMGQLLEVESEDGVIRIVSGEQAAPTEPPTAVVPANTSQPTPTVAESPPATPSEAPAAASTDKAPASPVVPLAALALVALAVVVVVVVVIVRR